MTFRHGPRDILDSFWRAAAYGLHPSVSLLSLAPLIVVGGVAAAFGYWFWEPSVAAVREALERRSLLDSVGLSGLRSVLAPLVIVAIAVPVCIVATLFVTSVALQPGGRAPAS